MKKLARSAIAIAALAIALSLGAAPAFAALRGDVNGDGNVNIIDAQMAYDMACGVTPKTTEADVNYNGYVDSADARAIQYYVHRGYFGSVEDPDSADNPNHKHSYSVTSKTEPTCTTDGITTYKCACGAVSTVTVKAAGHAFNAATCTHKATCSVCGVTTGNVLPHNYSEATCTEASVCSMCGAKGADALGHDSVYVVDVPESVTYEHVCTYCGAPYSREHAVEYGHGSSSTRKVTIPEQGHYECSRCGLTL
ncbi:MAG: dockerin type I repeat-containing protein [Coriobacteriia bacterium]|nr:dockerin type I repeat-containing protein [Coriobacteriia bacterium]